MSFCKRFKGLYGITDTKLMPDDQTMLACVEAALKGGMAILQYRDKGADHEKRFRQACLLKDLCRNYRATFIINDDISLAVACAADGVHLGAEDDSVTDARAQLGSDAIIGASCYGSLSRALIMQSLGADYVAFGACFRSAAKPEAAVNVEPGLLTDACQSSDIPVVAIGGITLDNAPGIIAPGVNMVAVISDLFCAGNIEVRACQYCQLFHPS